MYILGKNKKFRRKKWAIRGGNGGEGRDAAWRGEVAKKPGKVCIMCPSSGSVREGEARPASSVPRSQASAAENLSCVGGRPRQ